MHRRHLETCMAGMHRPGEGLHLGLEVGEEQPLPSTCPCVSCPLSECLLRAADSPGRPPLSVASSLLVPSTEPARPSLSLCDFSISRSPLTLLLWDALLKFSESDWPHGCPCGQMVTGRVSPGPLGSEGSGHVHPILRSLSS